MFVTLYGRDECLATSDSLCWSALPELQNRDVVIERTREPTSRGGPVEESPLVH